MSMNNLDRDLSIYNNTKCTSKSTCKFQRKKLEVDNTLGTFYRGDTFTDFKKTDFLLCLKFNIVTCFFNKEKSISQNHVIFNDPTNRKAGHPVSDHVCWHGSRDWG